MNIKHFVIEQDICGKKVHINHYVAEQRRYWQKQKTKPAQKCEVFFVCIRFIFTLFATLFDNLIII